MNLISWNVNGLRACLQKGFLDFFHQVNADFFCLQETKLQPGQLELELPGYELYWNSAEKRAIPALRFSQSMPPFPCSTAWVWRSWITRGGP